MKLSIRTRSMEAAELLQDLVAGRLQTALEAFADHVTDVSVQLADVNGPRGGVDKTCQIRAAVRGAREVVVKASGATASEALTRAGRRLRYRISESVRYAQRATSESVRTVGATA